MIIGKNGIILALCLTLSLAQREISRPSGYQAPPIDPNAVFMESMEHWIRWHIEALGVKNTTETNNILGLMFDIEDWDDNGIITMGGTSHISL